MQQMVGRATIKPTPRTEQNIEKAPTKERSKAVGNEGRSVSHRTRQGPTRPRNSPRAIRPATGCLKALPGWVLPSKLARSATGLSALWSVSFEISTDCEQTATLIMDPCSIPRQGEVEVFGYDHMTSCEVPLRAVHATDAIRFWGGEEGDGIR